jgi:hypothetical protein
MYKLNCLATFMMHDSLLNFRSVFFRHPVYKYWLKDGCYLDTSVFKLILRVFYNRTYLTPALDGCESIFV